MQIGWVTKILVQMAKGFLHLLGTQGSLIELLPGSQAVWAWLSFFKDPSYFDINDFYLTNMTSKFQAPIAPT